MTQTPALFVAHVGPSGFMPDSSFGPYQCDTRRELTATVDHVLQALDCSSRTRRQVDLVRVWREIQRRGNGRAGFILEDATTRTRVHFHNMTTGESLALEQEESDYGI